MNCEYLEDFDDKGHYCLHLEREDGKILNPNSFICPFWKPIPTAETRACDYCEQEFVNTDKIKRFSGYEFHWPACWRKQRHKSVKWIKTGKVDGETVKDEVIARAFRGGS